VLDVGRRRARPGRRCCAATGMRDRGCSLSGCTHEPSSSAPRPALAHGGATSLENTALLCTRTMSPSTREASASPADANGGLRFTDRDGAHHPRARAPAPPDDALGAYAPSRRGRHRNHAHHVAATRDFRRGDLRAAASAVIRRTPAPGGAAAVSAPRSSRRLAPEADPPAPECTAPWRAARAWFACPRAARSEDTWVPEPDVTLIERLAP